MFRLTAHAIRFSLLGFLTLWLLVGGDIAASERLVLHTSTALRDSGLFGELLPRHESATGIAVKVVAVGSGQALENARRGLADLVIVHDPIAEKRFVQNGFSKKRMSFATTRYQIIGPVSDPAGVANAVSWQDALTRLSNAGSKVRFVSRADESGTYTKERSLWQQIGIAPEEKLGRERYLRVGAGMGQTLTIADQLDAYTLTDQATFLARRHRMRLHALFSDDSDDLLNIYSVMVISSTRIQGRQQAQQHQRAIQFADWLLGEDARDVITSFSVDGIFPYRTFALKP